MVLLYGPRERRFLMSEVPPWTLHHTSQTLYLSPCPLHPAPYTIHPAPCITHHTPCTLAPNP